MIQWQTLACLVAILIFAREIITSIQKLYVNIYSTSYTLGKATQEAEDTKQLLTAIAQVKKDYPEAEEAFIVLWGKLTGQTTEEKKTSVENRAIGFK